MTSDFILYLNLRCRRYSVFRCPSSSALSESVHPENLVNAISPKPMEGISPKFGHRRMWIRRCAD